MDTINIGGNTQDRFYRYKMPKLISKIEGKGNGIKTVVPNMPDIARSLSRPPTYPTKFFGCELGAQVKCDEKNDRYIVNGAHDAPRLQELLDIFIKKFVLCAGCTCGQRTEVDMRHKLVTYILKNPPSPPKGKNGKKDRRNSNKKSTEDGENPPSPVTEEGSDDDLTKRIQAEASELPASNYHVDDDDWAVDTSAEAVAKRMKDLEDNVRTTLVLADLDEDNPYDEFNEWLEENPGSTNNEIYKKIKELGISKDSDQIMKHLVIGLFAENFQKNQKNADAIAKQFVTDPDDQRTLLGATEELILKNKGLLESKVICGILMGYYQNDLLDEEVFTVWIEGNNSSNYQRLFKRVGTVEFVDSETNQDIRNKAKPFAKCKETDEIWKYYNKKKETSDGHYSAECYHCKESWSREKSAKLKAHLAKECLKCPEKIRKYWKKKLIFEHLSKTIPINDHFNYFNSNEERPPATKEQIDQSLIRAFIMTGIPFKDNFLE
ncbi:10925_t:CDS:2 [Diversispora eburnea]|uniref:10925_t:CDS:1 n=1 Tax=Diversispora eburnea TaxID=1213867 RepID=A0A9N8UWM5_9GLOM|nr:10925_t:CDS:2 [Diversispora eburnea]